MDYVTDIGKVLLDLCSIAQMNNVNIQIFRDGRYGVDRKIFELRINRDTFYASEIIDLDECSSRPAEALEYAFNRAMYNLKFEINQKRNNFRKDVSKNEHMA